VRQVSLRWVDGGTLLSRRDLADGRGGDSMVEATQLALDANHAPGPVLLRQAQDERDQFTADRRTTRRFWLSPPRGDQWVAFNHLLAEQAATYNDDIRLISRDGPELGWKLPPELRHKIFDLLTAR
jgi:hypothetical protein